MFLAFKDKEVIKIASHSEGNNFLALTKDGGVYSWGSGECGRLGKIVYSQYGHEIYSTVILIQSSQQQ